MLLDTPTAVLLGAATAVVGFFPMPVPKKDSPGFGVALVEEAGVVLVVLVPAELAVTGAAGLYLLLLLSSAAELSVGFRLAVTVEAVEALSSRSR